MITWRELNQRGKCEKLGCEIFMESRPVVVCNVDAMLSQCSSFCDDVLQMFAHDFSLTRQFSKIIFAKWNSLSKVIMYDKNT